MTTRALASPPARAVRDAGLAGLAGALAPYLAAFAWSLLASAVWGTAARGAVFVDPTTSRPTGYVAASLLFAVAVGALLGAVLARALTRARVARWGPWVAFAAGALLSAAGVDAHALRSPLLLLLIASSALGFRLGARG